MLVLPPEPNAELKVPQTREEIDRWLGRFVRVTWKDGVKIEGLSAGADGHLVMCLMFPHHLANHRQGDRMAIYLQQAITHPVVKIESALALRFCSSHPEAKSIARIGSKLVRSHSTPWMTTMDFLRDITATFGAKAKNGRRGLRKQVEDELRKMRTVR